MQLPGKEIWLKRSYRKHLCSIRLNILVSVLIIIATVFFVVHFSFFERYSQMKFFIQFLWPSGVIFILATIWVNIIRNFRRGVGRTLYYIIEADLKKNIIDGGTKAICLGYLSDERDGLLSNNASLCEDTLDRLIQKFKKAGCIIQD